MADAGQLKAAHKHEITTPPSPKSIAAQRHKCSVRGHFDCKGILDTQPLLHLDAHRVRLSKGRTRVSNAASSSACCSIKSASLFMILPRACLQVHMHLAQAQLVLESHWQRLSVVYMLHTKLGSISGNNFTAVLTSWPTLDCALILATSKALQYNQCRKRV